MALIIGHSQAKYLSRYLMCGSFIDVLPFSGFRLPEFWAEVESKVQQYNVIVILAGANDIPGNSVRTVLERFQSLCESIHGSNISAKVLVCSVLPRKQNGFSPYTTDFIRDYNDVAAAVNSTFEDVSDLLPWLEYISFPGFKDHHLSRDGIHLSFKGTELVASVIEDNILKQETLHNPRQLTADPLTATPNPEYQVTGSELESVKSIDSATTVVNLEGQEVLNCELPDYFIGPKTYRDSLLTSSTFRKCSPVRLSSYVTDSNKPKRKKCPETRESRFTTVPKATESEPRTVQKNCNKARDRKSSVTPVSRRTSSSLLREELHQKKSVNRFEVLNVEKCTVITEEEDVTFRLSDSRTTVKTSKKRSEVEVKELTNRFVLTCNNVTLTGGGYENTVYMTQKKLITWQEAKLIMDNPEISRITTDPPYKPKAGEVYLFSTEGDPKKAEDWRADQYIWVNGGGYGCPKGQTSFWKKYFKISTAVNDRTGSNEFQRHAFMYKDKPEFPYILVHYTGDESVYVPRPHGNKLKDEVPYKRTCPSVLTNIKEMCTENRNDNVHKVYKKLTTGNVVHAVRQSVKNPRNDEQVRNIAKRVRRDYRLSHDEIYSTLELACHIDSFVHKLSIFPDLQCVFASKELLNELNNLIGFQSDETLLMSYDTTFTVGQNFLSVLSFQHIMFENSKCIPVAFLIHYRKDQRSHEVFFETILELVPNLKNRQTFIVTDRERAITNAIQKVLHKTTNFFCWNHLTQDLGRWLDGKKASSDDKLVYKTDIDTLLRAESFEEFDELERVLSEKWCLSMKEYFMQSLRSDILNHCVKFKLSEANLFDESSGITNNISEGLNTLIKKCASWAGIPMDSVVLSLFYLQRFKFNEVIRGRLQTGTLKLKNIHQDQILDPENVEMPRDICAPDDIIDYVKNGKTGQTEKLNQTSEITNATITDDRNSEDPIAREHITSQRAMALDVLKNKRIVHVPDMGSWVVEGSNGDKYSVSLFPKPKCQCVALNKCYHILAVEMSVGIEEINEKRTINLTALKLNTRKRQNRIAGKKSRGQ